LKKDISNGELKRDSYYQPLEVLVDDTIHTTQADMWSVGVLVLQLELRKEPSKMFPDVTSPESLVAKLASLTEQDLPNMDNRLFAMLKSLLKS
jgi:serine/threonine protein kinase